MDSAPRIERGSDKARFAQQSVRSPSSPERTAPLWLAAAFFAAALSPGAQAQTRNPADLQGGAEQEQSRAELARELAAARQDVMSLRQSLQKEQERAETLTQELTMAHVRIYAFEAQARQAGDHAAELKQTAEGGVADLRTSLQQERDRVSRLEQDVAAARQDVEKQTALAVKAGEEARQMKQAADSAAELQKSLEQEQERTASLEQDVAAARRDLQKQTARPAKAKASRTKQTAVSSAARWFRSNSIWNFIFAPPRR